MLILRELIKGYRYMNDELSDPRTRDYPLISSPMYLLAFLYSYVYFVKVFGPKMMKHRAPFQLDRLIQVYDFIQILLSFWVAERTISNGWFTKYSKTCQPVDYSYDPLAVYTTKIVYAYFLIKITDLLDTVFFVLRKKNNQISFLHVYHHTGMVLGTWIAVKYIPGGHFVFIGLINSMVHVVMYAYYLFTSIYPEHKKNLWWKKYITQMQMVQFFLITLHTGQLFFQPNCDFPIIFPILLTPNNFTITILFYNFYRKTYTNEKIEASMKKAEASAKVSDYLPDPTDAQ